MATPGPMMGQPTALGSFFQKPLGAMTKKIQEIRTPGWQLFMKVLVFLTMTLIFGIVYQVMIGNNPEEWSHPTDGDDNPIVNGWYVATVVNSTVGYGDYYPYSQRAIMLVCFNVLISWVMFTMFLG